MPAKKVDPAPAEDPDELVPMNFRAPRRLGPALDRWVADLNKTRTWPKMTKPDLMRAVLEWAAKTRPDFEKP